MSYSNIIIICKNIKIKIIKFNYFYFLHKYCFLIEMLGTILVNRKDII